MVLGSMLAPSFSTPILIDSDLGLESNVSITVSCGLSLV